MSKDKGESRNTSRLGENEVFDEKSSDEDEKHTVLLTTKQSSKNKSPFENQSARNTCNHNEAGVRVCGDAVLRLLKTKRFSVFTNLVNFDVLYAVF